MTTKKRKRIGLQLRVRILARDGYACLMCGRTSKEVALHVDHIVPVADGGSDDLENLASLCRECNIGKSDLRLRSYLQTRARGDRHEDPLAQLRDAWEAIVGENIQLEPLYGVSEATSRERWLKWFKVTKVTDADVEFEKQSSTETVRLPLPSLGRPWGHKSAGGLRATIEKGRLIFDPEAERWDWHP